MYGRFAHVTGLRMYVRWEWLPVQQTKWYRGVFHTRCAVYVKAFVFDGSSQMERTREDGAFFTPCRRKRAHAADICRMPKKERGKNNEYAGHRIDRSRVSVWRLYALRPLAG